MIKEKISILWLKRDIRSHDHGCFDICSKLTLGDKNFKVLPLFVEESEYWKSNKSSEEQREFVRECVIDLNKNLRNPLNANNHNNVASERGLELFVTTEFGNSVLAIKKLQEHYIIETIFCHRETGNQWTFHRDIAMKKLCKISNINLIEIKGDCLVRGRKGSNDFQNLRQEFSRRYYHFYNTSQFSGDICLRKPRYIPEWLIEQTQNYIYDIKPRVTSSKLPIQIGGESIGKAVLQEFLETRCLTGKGYRSEMSNPLIGSVACSRISAHLSWGSLSHRTAFQSGSKLLEDLKNSNYPRNNSYKANQIQSFLTRLAWRSHFMQKFESLDWMEFRCINPRAESLRQWNQELFERWKTGQTGYPFVDACMRSLNQTKWLNFRARALVVSFASYALNLDWRGFGPHLAASFLDYEPGIHYSQLQMQSGTTLGSTTRIYSPLKQSVEKDPKGAFIRKWVPELSDINTSLIHIPNESSRNGYPSAIIPMDRLWATMRSNTIQRKTQVNLTPKPINRQRVKELKGSNFNIVDSMKETQQELLFA